MIQGFAIFDKILLPEEVGASYTVTFTAYTAAGEVIDTAQATTKVIDPLAPQPKRTGIAQFSSGSSWIVDGKAQGPVVDNTQYYLDYAKNLRRTLGLADK